MTVLTTCADQWADMLDSDSWLQIACQDPLDLNEFGVNRIVKEGSQGVGGPVFGEHASESVVADESTEWLDLWRLCIDSAGSRGGGIDGDESGASALP